MTTYAPSTCGFLPEHLYWDDDLARASTIVHAINLFALEGMGVASRRADPKRLQDLSLQQMLDAVRVVERWNARPKMEGVGYEMSMVPDDRLTAAVYTLVHFYDARAFGAEDDHIPVRFTVRSRWTGEDHVHFLLVGNRDVAHFDDDEDEERDAA